MIENTELKDELKAEQLLEIAELLKDSFPFDYIKELKEKNRSA